jgi:predicted anti-sigma-YlaC factor YlaD
MCPEESIFLNLVAGQVTAQTREALEAHVSECARCRELLAELRQVHEMLGEWTVSPPSIDLSAAVLQAARQQPAARRWWMSAAAAVLLAGSAGLIAGLVVPSPMEAAAPVTDEQVVDALGLDALVEQSAMFVPLLNLEEPAATGKEPS